MSLYDEYCKNDIRCVKEALARLLLNSWYGMNCFDTVGMIYGHPLKGKKGDKEMSTISILSEKLNILAKELKSELEDNYSVDIEFHLSTSAVSNPNYVKILINEGVWCVNQITVNIDLDAPVSETILHTKNKFNTAVKFDRYRKRKYTLNSIIEKLNEDKKFIANKVWWCGESDMLCMRTSNSTNGISRYPLNGKITFDGKDYKDMINHFDGSTFYTFVIKDYYPEFKSYVRKFMSPIDVYDDFYSKEGDNYDLHVNNGFCTLSEVDVKSFETLNDFESFCKRRREAELKQ